MKRAGFEKIHLLLETIQSDLNRQWNRRHASTESSERALEAAVRAGFKPRTQEINALWNLSPHLRNDRAAYNEEFYEPSL